MPDHAHVIKLNVPVYAYVNEDGTVAQVIIWDINAGPGTVHRYDPRPNADDAGPRVDNDEAARVIAAYNAAEDHPGWDFGC